jgi:hypothetical protein
MVCLTVALACTMGEAGKSAVTRNLGILGLIQNDATELSSF